MEVAKGISRAGGLGARDDDADDALTRIGASDATDPMASFNQEILEEAGSDYEPADEEIVEYARWLGVKPHEERDLVWIAKEGLRATLPENWKPCRTGDGQVYYFKFATGESDWDHPCDALFRAKVVEEREKRNTDGEARAKTDGATDTSASSDADASSFNSTGGGDTSRRSKQSAMFLDDFVSDVSLDVSKTFDRSFPSASPRPPAGKGTPSPRRVGPVVRGLSRTPLGRIDGNVAGSVDRASGAKQARLAPSSAGSKRPTPSAAKAKRRKPKEHDENASDVSVLSTGSIDRSTHSTHSTHSNVSSRRGRLAMLPSRATDASHCVRRPEESEFIEPDPESGTRSNAATSEKIPEKTRRLLALLAARGTEPLAARNPSFGTIDSIDASRANTNTNGFAFGTGGRGASTFLKPASLKPTDAAAKPKPENVARVVSGKRFSDENADAKRRELKLDDPSNEPEVVVLGTLANAETDAEALESVAARRLADAARETADAAASSESSFTETEPAARVSAIDARGLGAGVEGFESESETLRAQFKAATRSNETGASRSGLREPNPNPILAKPSIDAFERNANIRNANHQTGSTWERKSFETLAGALILRAERAAVSAERAAACASAAAAAAETVARGIESYPYRFRTPRVWSSSPRGKPPVSPRANALEHPSRESRESRESRGSRGFESDTRGNEARGSFERLGISLQNIAAKATCAGGASPPELSCESFPSAESLADVTASSGSFEIPSRPTTPKEADAENGRVRVRGRNLKPRPPETSSRRDSSLSPNGTSGSSRERTRASFQARRFSPTGGSGGFQNGPPETRPRAAYLSGRYTRSGPSVPWTALGEVSRRASGSRETSAPNAETPSPAAAAAAAAAETCARLVARLEALRAAGQAARARGWAVGGDASDGETRARREMEMDEWLERERVSLGTFRRVAAFVS